ncbi:hypothetical protein D3C76_1476230 [compost metagenome]
MRITSGLLWAVAVLAGDVDEAVLTAMTKASIRWAGSNYPEIVSKRTILFDQRTFDALVNNSQ